MCVHAVTIQHRGRATRSIDHDTHGHRLGQDKAQAGFEHLQPGSESAGPGSRDHVSPHEIKWCVLLKRKLNGRSCITKTEKAESEAQRGKPKGTLESESRNAIE